MSMAAEDASFAGIVDSIEVVSGWTITIDEEVSSFTHDEGYDRELWSTILVDVMEDHLLCWSVDVFNHTIDIYNCS